jgi:TPR repeat protein
MLDQSYQQAQIYNPELMRAVWFGASVMVVMLAWSAAIEGEAGDEVERALAAARVRAARGDVVAQFSLASLLYYASRDTAGAVQWFRKAAAQRYAPAEFQMGQLYDFGFGVTRDDRRALDWYVKAAQHGDAAASRAAGDFYRRGRGVATDLAEAARWYRRAADGDDLRAQYQLAQMYFDGTGVERDYVSAYVWFDIAAGQTPLIDNQKAILELRNIAAARMSPDALTEAERRAGAWKPGVGH